jgi:hypothetical protein
MRAVVLAAAAGLALGCTFDGARADVYRCDQAGRCPAGQVCEDAICLAAPDAGLDGAGPPDAATPPDAAHDVAGDAPRPPDAAADDGPAQEDAPPQQDAPPGCVFDPLVDAAQHFEVVLSVGTWQFDGVGYAQTAQNDLRVSWVNAEGGPAPSIDATVTVTAQGNDNFITPHGNFSLAGVVVRARGLADTSITGYFCGVDARGDQLTLGLMSGGYAPNIGSLTVLRQEALTVPLDTPLRVHADAQGESLTCSSGAVQIAVTDAQISTGSVGLFTIGARARFTDALYCVP